MSEETTNQDEVIVRREYYDALLTKAAERDAMMTKVFLIAQDRDKKTEAITQQLFDAQTKIAELETAIRAMWPIFALALAYGEHGRASEHNGLRRLAEEARNGGVPKHVMDTILEAAEGL